MDDLVVAWGGQRGRALPPLVQPLGAPLIGADVVVVHDEWGRDAPMVALGLRDGVERWRRPGAMHLARLVGGRLATTRRSVDEGAEVVIYGIDGTEYTSSTQRGQVFIRALTPELVMCSIDRPDRGEIFQAMLSRRGPARPLHDLCGLDVVTGQLRLHLPADEAISHEISMARGTIYARHADGIAVIPTSTPAARFSLPLPAVPPPPTTRESAPADATRAMAALPGRLLVRQQTRLLCYG